MMASSDDSTIDAEQPGGEQLIDLVTLDAPLRAMRRLAEQDDEGAGEDVRQHTDHRSRIGEPDVASRFDEQVRTREVAQDHDDDRLVCTPPVHTAAATAPNRVTSGSVLPIHGSSR